MIAGGLALALASHLGLIGRLEKYFTADTVGTVILLIAFATLPFLLPLMLGQGQSAARGDPPAAGMALLVALLIPALGHWLTGLGKSLSVFICLIIGTVAFAFTGRVETGGLAAAPWFGLPLPWPQSTPGVNAPALAAAFLAYLVVILNLKGSLAAVMSIVGGEQEAGQRMKRSAAMSGWSGVPGRGHGHLRDRGLRLFPRGDPGHGRGQPVHHPGRRGDHAGAGVLLQSGRPADPGAPARDRGGPGGGPVRADRLRAEPDLPGKAGPWTAEISSSLGLPLLLGTLSSLIGREFIALLPPLIGPLAGNGMVVGLLCLILLERVLLRKK